MHAQSVTMPTACSSSPPVRALGRYRARVLVAAGPAARVRFRNVELRD
jgi:hypothetical protein